MNNSSTTAQHNFRQWAWLQQVGCKSKMVLLAVAEVGDFQGLWIDVPAPRLKKIANLVGIPEAKVGPMICSLSDQGVLDLKGKAKSGFVLQAKELGVPHYEHLGLPSSDIRSVYLIQAGAFFKIGVAKSPDERIRSISTGSSSNVKLLASRVVGNARGYERALHEHFQDRRRNGEWFALSKPELRALLTVLAREDLSVA